MVKKNNTKLSEKNKPDSLTEKSGVKKPETKKSEQAPKDTPQVSANDIQTEANSSAMTSEDHPDSATKSTETSKRKKKTKKYKFLYYVGKKNYIRSNTTFGHKQKNQPTLKHKKQKQFYVENPVPKAPLLTKLLKFTNCQVKNLVQENIATEKITQFLFTPDLDDTKRQDAASAVFPEIQKNPEILQGPDVPEKTISKVSGAVLIHAIDCLNYELFGKAKLFMQGAQILKIPIFYRVFLNFVSNSKNFGPKFPEFTTPIVQCFEALLECHRKKTDMKKEEYQKLKQEKETEIKAILQQQILLNKGVEILYQNAVSGIGQRFEIEKISQHVKLMTEVIYRCYVSEILYRAFHFLGRHCGTKNFREDPVRWALADMGLEMSS